MSLIDKAFIVLLVAAVGLNSHNRRGLLWLALLAFNYAVSTVLHRAHVWHPEFWVALLDFSVCLSIFLWARQRWEMWVWMLFQTSMLVGILYFVNNNWALGFISHDAYSTVLEAIMAAALLTISGVGAWQKAGRFDAVAFNPRVSIFGPVLPLHGKAAAYRSR